ncbi:MAG TPA: lipopolysaccharide heptosyltransferase II [Bryobacteraceae bacterium]|nr:lipopolysaccharide heptosyltransferase II [Bryobacteraceae bacterium]
MKILIRTTNWIGDALMSLPAVCAIRSRFPDAEITVLAKPWVAALYEGERSIDRVMILEGAPGAKDWGAKWKLARRLRKESFDLAILLPNSFESAAVVRLAGVKRIIGYARDGRALLLTDAIPLPKANEIPAHERFYYLELLRRAGLLDEIPDVPEIRLDGIAGLRARGEARFSDLGMNLPVIGVSPGAAYGAAKRWLPERFAEAAARLAAGMGGSVAIFGSAAEKPLCEEVARAASGRSFAGATTLAEFIEMTAACLVFLTNDSGAMHIAAALGIPSVTVFGPTNETATGPLGAAARIVREPVDCAPCLLRECPIDHRCMTRVTAEKVVMTAEDLLKIRPVTVSEPRALL